MFFTAIAAATAFTASQVTKIVVISGVAGAIIGGACGKASHDSRSSK